MPRWVLKSFANLLYLEVNPLRPTLEYRQSRNERAQQLQTQEFRNPIDFRIFFFLRMKRKARYIASLDEVTFTREGEYAVIQYKEEGISGTHLKIGPELAQMSDEEVLELHNDCLRAEAERAANFKHVAVELPLNSPQIRYLEEADQWVPRGGVLRCVIHDNEEGRLVVEIDDRELSLEEFGRLLTTYAGWGMRIEFVPEDAVHRRPNHEVRDLKPEED